MKLRTSSQGMAYDAGDGFIVYFDPDSGKTHLINEVAAWLLAELATTPISIEYLQDCVLDRVEGVSGSEVERLVTTLIQELQSFDLIETI